MRISGHLIFIEPRFPFCFPAVLILAGAGLEEAKNPAGKNVLRLIQVRHGDAEFGKNLACLSSKLDRNCNPPRVRGRLAVPQLLLGNCNSLQ
jgi:hypothetical protein